MITPLNRNVLVKPKAQDETTSSGLILTTTTTEKPCEGLIVTKAEDCKLRIKEGDIVLYNKYAGSIAQIADLQYLILNEEDILGIRK